MWLKVVTTVVLVAHGIGHVMAPQAAFLPPGAFPSQATAIVGSGLTIVSPAGKALAVLWLLPLVGFLLGTYGFWTGQEWGRPMLVAASIISILAVLPWWGVMPSMSYLGALAVDIAVLVVLLTPWGEGVIRAMGD